MGLKYMGGGFVPGVPARDLTDAEARQYGERGLVASGLYRAVSKSRRPAAENKLELPDYQDKAEHAAKE